jgi:diguanylate cyclase (GGDEF)-like protein
MTGAAVPENEHARLRSLRALGILDTDPEERFDRLTRVARRVFEVPIALLSLVDDQRQFYKSRVGTDMVQTDREHSFCAHAILDGDSVMVVRDATEDERFRTNPLVTGAPEIRFYAACPVRAPDGHLLGTLCVIDHEPRSLPELVEQELKSLALAATDELTGLANRRGFEAIARHTLATALRVEQPATLLLFDLNNFKLVNDNYGHVAGDRVLVRFAAELRSTFRDSDVVARLGGDEFCVLLSGATQEEARRPLGELERKLGETEGEVNVSFSVGAATYERARHRTVAALVEEADDQMYADKRADGARRRV